MAPGLQNLHYKPHKPNLKNLHRYGNFIVLDLDTPRTQSLMRYLFKV